MSHRGQESADEPQRQAWHPLFHNCSCRTCVRVLRGSPHKHQQPRGAADRCHEARPLYCTVTLMELATELHWINTGCLVLRSEYLNEMQSINLRGYSSHEVIKIFKCEKLLVCLRVKPKANLRKLIWIFLKQ